DEGTHGVLVQLGLEALEGVLGNGFDDGVLRVEALGDAAGDLLAEAHRQLIQRPFVGHGSPSHLVTTRTRRTEYRRAGLSASPAGLRLLAAGVVLAVERGGIDGVVARRGAG